MCPCARVHRTGPVSSCRGSPPRCYTPRPNALHHHALSVPRPRRLDLARVPKKHAPPVTHGWGRTPVIATVDGHTWHTSVWRDTTYGTLLAVPKKVRGAKEHGARVTVELRPREPGDDARKRSTL